MGVVFYQVFILFAFAVIGYVLGKTKKADIRQSKLLSVLSVYVFLPANVFRTFSSNFNRTYLSEKYYYVLLSAVVLLCVVLMASVVSKWFCKEGFERSIYHYSLAIPNFGYMGYALAESLFGSEGLLNVMMFGLPMSLYVYSAAFCMLTKQKFSPKQLLKPTIIAIVLGCLVGLLEIKLPAIATDILGKASGCMGPVSMLLTGLTVAEFKLKNLLFNPKLYIMTGLRLLVIPCAIAGALMLVGAKDAVMPALLIYAMPCGLNTIVFPKLIGEDCHIGAGLACISSVLACVTIPICIELFL